MEIFISCVLPLKKSFFQVTLAVRSMEKIQNSLNKPKIVNKNKVQS